MISDQVLAISLLGWMTLNKLLNLTRSTTYLIVKWDIPSTYLMVLL